MNKEYWDNFREIKIMHIKKDFSINFLGMIIEKVSGKKIDIQ